MAKVKVLRRISDGMVFPLLKSLMASGSFEIVEIEPGKGIDCVDENGKAVNRHEYQKSAVYKREQAAKLALEEREAAITEAKEENLRAAQEAERLRVKEAKDAAVVAEAAVDADGDES